MIACDRDGFDDSSAMSLLLDRFALFYPMRIVGTTFMVTVVGLYAWQAHRFDAFYVTLIVVFAIYPHIVQHVARKYPQSRRKIELRTFLFDSFTVGLVVHAIGLAPLPTFVLITVALASALSVDGLRQMLLSAAGVVVGIGAFAVFEGFNVGGGDRIAIDIASSVFTFVYFMAFAYSAHNRSALLQRSEAELRERSASLEIEKLRSDRLLFNLVPARLAAKMSAPGGIRPTRFDPVVLVAIELRQFSKALAREPADDVLAYLMHCFKAFDAIADRFGLEKLKTFGDTYIAIAGLPAPGARDGAASIEAALAMREFLDDLAQSRRAHDKFVFGARIAVHAGAVVGSIVETSKLSYDVFGEPMKTLLAVLRAGDDGEIVVSDAARRLAGDGFAWRDVQGGAGFHTFRQRVDGVRPHPPNAVAVKA
jgi:class 3 adenylate cyclase